MTLSTRGGPPRSIRVIRKRKKLIEAWLNSSALPRPLRVARKRLRALGLWPVIDDVGSRDFMDALRQAAPELASAFVRTTPYDAWIRANTLTPAAEVELRRLLWSEPDLPRLSIVTPVYNTPPEYLRAMVESVQAQIYEHWELCLADDASTRQDTRTLIAEITKSDPRIVSTRLTANGGISEATNAAAALATGDVLVFVDHDDLLTRDCLAEVALYYSRNPLSDIVYSDDDKIDDTGRRYDPQFKPDWAPALLLSFMYMSHVLTVRRSLFGELGGFRRAFDGSQDFDFALRAAERARHVGHIPRILYHWRAAPGSTAVSGDAKPESFEAGRVAVEEAINRRGIEAEVLHPDWALRARVGMFSLRFPDDGPSVTIIVPTYNKAGLLRDCITSLQKTTYNNYDVLIVDNGSDDADTLDYLASLEGCPGYSVIRTPQAPGGFSFAALNNQAVRRSTGDFVLFLNNDTVVIEPRWLSQMVGYGRMENVGSVGARLYFQDGTVQHAGIVAGYNEGLVGHAFRAAEPHDWGYMGFIRTAREYGALTAACLLTPRTLFTEIGGFDEDNFAVAYNDVDYGFRLADSGYRNLYCPDAELFHLEGKSRNCTDKPTEVIALRQKYGYRYDPWYNPNLSLEDEHHRIQSRRLPARSGKPVRVIAVSHNLNYEGAPNTLFDLIVGLRNSGAIDPVVLAPATGPLKAAYESAGIPVMLFNFPHGGASEDVFLGARDCLAGLFIALGGEVVVANTLQMFVAINAATRAGLGSIWCQHESEPWETYYRSETPAVRSHAYAAFNQAYRVTYVANATRLAWAPVQTRANAQVIRHGIPAARMAAELGRWTRSKARDHLDVKASDLVVILMGTVCRRKGQLDLAAALAHLPLEVAICLRVYVVGALAEADYAGQLAEAVAALPPLISARVTVAGPVEDMAVYYAAADISVCTSRIESAPRIIVESMAFGLPIITTPVFGIPELVEEGVNALFYPANSPHALAEALLVLSTDEGRRRSLAASSRAVLESKPGYDEMLHNYTRIFREAALLRSEPACLVENCGGAFWS